MVSGKKEINIFLISSIEHMFKLCPVVVAIFDRQKKNQHMLMISHTDRSVNSFVKPSEIQLKQYL
jgi:hypothetical protein